MSPTFKLLISFLLVLTVLLITYGERNVSHQISNLSDFDTAQELIISLPGVEIDTSLIMFKGATVKNIMQTISEYYKVRVIYEGGIPKGKYTATIDCNVNIVEMVRILNSAGIKASYGNRILLIEE